MEDKRKISLCIPTWERIQMTLDSFSEVYDDSRISDIQIVDDSSSDNVFSALKAAAANLPKIHLTRNDKNLDCYLNKKEAISKAQQSFAILLDSDNSISSLYIDKLYEIKDWDAKTAYMPMFAYPTFSYERYSGLTISKENVSTYMDMPLFSTMLNCMNYFVNAAEYIRCFDDSVNPYTADSLYQNYNWFKNGNQMYVVGGMTYFHRIHDQSHYKQNNHKTGLFYNEVEKKIRSLK